MIVYDRYIELLRGLSPLLAKIEKRDRDLARQFRRAAASVALNIAEGENLRGGNSRLRFETALGSAKECKACIDLASAFRYANTETCRQMRSRFDETAAMLWCIVRR